MNVKIEQELNFVVDSRLFLDAQEAKKVSERTVDDFDKFRPELLKTPIARIPHGSHMPGFPVDGHIYEGTKIQLEMLHNGEADYKVCMVPLHIFNF